MNIMTRTMLIHTEWRSLSVVLDVILIALLIASSLVLCLTNTLHDSILRLAEVS